MIESLQTSQGFRVDFFVAGVQKGGTSALDGLLRGHPAIGMAEGKEAHFFNRDSVDWKRPDYAPYHARFEAEDPQGRVFGDATPIYLYWPGALARIARYNPAARFVICLRHPAHRAYSQWLMERARGKEPLPFAEAIRAPGRARLDAAPNRAHPTYSYVERGLYGDQVGELLRLFPREAVRFVRTDRLWAEPAAVMAELQAFLGVEPRPVAATPRYVSIPPSGGGLPIPAQEQAFLTELLAGQIQQAQALTGIDLSDWLDPAYQEPMEA